MLKRKFRSRRRQDSDEEPDDLEGVLADAAIARHEKSRMQGVSVSAAFNDQCMGT